MSAVSSRTQLDNLLDASKSRDIAINPLNAQLWKLSPLPDWLQDRLLAGLQNRWEDVGLIEIAHSVEPENTRLLKNFKVGVDVFESNNDRGVPKEKTMITDSSGRWELMWRCGRERCAECEATRERKGWVRRIWDGVVRRRT